MPKFIVTLQVITWHDYQVEAESLAEAEAIARERRGQEGWKQEGSTEDIATVYEVRPVDQEGVK